MSDKNYKNLKKEFIKSTAILVLALVLLVTAVVAWFSDSQSADIGDFLLSIETEDGGIFLGDDVAVERDVVLPCATKVDDSAISVSDFSKAIYVETFDINASNSVNNAVISVTSDESDIHYYIDGLYDSNDTPMSLAQTIKNDTAEVHRNKDFEIDFTESDQPRTRKIAVVFWGNYTDSSSAAIKNGNMSFEALVKFSVKE